MVTIRMTYDQHVGLFVGTDTVYGIMSQGQTEEQCAQAVEDAVQSFVLVSSALGMDPLLICPGCQWGGNA